MTPKTSHTALLTSSMRQKPDMSVLFIFIVGLGEKYLPNVQPIEPVSCSWLTGIIAGGCDGEGSATAGLGVANIRLRHSFRAEIFLRMSSNVWQPSLTCIPPVYLPTELSTLIIPILKNFFHCK